MDYTPNLSNPLWLGDQRLDAILNGSGGIITFDSSRTCTAQSSKAYPWYSAGWVGATAVEHNEASIEKYARQYGVQVDLLRAVIYIENAHGWYDEANPFRETSRPGNVKTRHGRMVTVLAMYVSRRIRDTMLGGRVTLRMMRVLSDWAKAQGALEIHVHSTSGIAPQRTDRMLRKLGFRTFGGSYAAQLQSL